MKNIKLRSFLILCLCFLILTISGCWSKNTANNPPVNDPNPPQTEPNPTEPATPSPEPETVEVTIYFPTPDAGGMKAEVRSIAASEQNIEEIIYGIFAEFAKPPAGLVAPLPQNTQLLDVKVKDGVATLNLSQAFHDNFSGGATGEQMVLYSIVNTLTALEEVDAVEFLLEGELRAAILGGIDTSTPVTANESLILQ